MTETTEVTMIEPSRGIAGLDLGEIWKYRELLYFLTLRDVKVRYKQTLVGVAWAVIQPVLTTAIFTVIFSNFARFDTGSVPYPLFALSGLIIWLFVHTSISLASSSFVNNTNLVTKVYFPRLGIPVATVLSGAVDFALAFLLLLFLMLYFDITPTITALWVLPLLLLAFVTALGAGLWLAALNVQYRDVRYTLPFLTQLWLFATPIAYPSSLLPDSWRTVYGINPMAGVVEGFRWALLGTNTAPGPMILISALAALLLLVSGMFYFRRVEDSFADVI